MTFPTISTRLIFDQRIDPSRTGINIIHNGPILYIISQLKGNDLCNIAQISRRFNTLIEQYRERLYIKEDFDTLLGKKVEHVKLSTGDIFAIKWLARHHPERKCSSKVLNWASENGYTKIVRLLIAENKPCTDYALNMASQNGHTEIVKLLLAAPHRPIGAIENYPEGSSPYSDCTIWALVASSMLGYTEIVKLLLATNKEGVTLALKLASTNGHTEVVKLLLAANKEGVTWALKLASTNDHTEVVKLLLAADN